MQLQDTDLLLRLLLAHFVVDFLSGTEKSKRKDHAIWKSGKFYVHLGLVGLTTYVFAWQWTNAWMPLTILLLHGLIDWVHSSLDKGTPGAFLLDQLLHLVAIIACWALATSLPVHELVAQLTDFLSNSYYLSIVLGYLLMTVPGGVLIGYLTQKWRKEIFLGDKDTSSEESLQHAGKWIGMLERALVLTFILLGEWRPIGFLLAAKSIFRFGDLKEPKDRQRTEYILIGTLLSFTFAIIIGLIITSLS
ncbi:MAG: DUF3307 domain-containing protein [Bacteroidota bacterium]